MRVQGRVWSMGLSGISLRLRSVRGSLEGGQHADNILGEWPEHKLSLGDADVRDLEAIMVDLEILVQENIEIDVPGPLVDHLLAAQGVLDVLERIKQG